MPTERRPYWLAGWPTCCRPLAAADKLLASGLKDWPSGVQTEATVQVPPLPETLRAKFKKRKMQIDEMRASVAVFKGNLSPRFSVPACN